MYFLRPRTHRLLILVLFATLLFSRVALASYVCPLPQLQAMATVSQMKSTDCTESENHSTMIDEAQPALCAQHFSDEKQATGAATQPLASEPAFFIAYPLPLPLLPQAWPAGAYDFVPDPGGEEETLFLLTLRLRI